MIPTVLQQSIGLGNRRPGVLLLVSYYLTSWQMSFLVCEMWELNWMIVNSFYFKGFCMFLKIQTLLSHSLGVLFMYSNH